MDQTTEDLHGLTISSIEACCVSLRASMPLTAEQMKELDEIYEKLLVIQQQAAGITPPIKEAS